MHSREKKGKRLSVRIRKAPERRKGEFVMEKTDLKTQLAEVAERIRTMREIMGLSEEEMAKCTDVTREEYRKCEAGEADFSFTFIYKCATDSVSILRI